MAAMEGVKTLKLLNFDELLDQLAALDEVPVEGLSDELLATLRKEHRFVPILRGDLTKILSRFYELYFFGTIRKGDNWFAIVCDAVAIAETAMGPIWQNNPPESKEFYQRNTSTGQELTRATPAVSELTCPTISRENVDVGYNGSRIMYTKAKMANFEAEVRANIQKIKNSETITEDEKKFKMMTGFLALTFWSAAVKDKNQMKNIFLKQQYRQDLTTLAGWAAGKPWSPPCADCIEKIVMYLRKGHSVTSAFFIIVSNEFVLTQKGNYRDPAVAGYLTQSVLTHTAMNGLGMVKLVEQACSILHIDWKTLHKYTNLKQTTTTWKRLTKFFSTYLSEDLQYGYKWARIINDRCLLDLTPKENMMLATILAGIIEQTQGEGIWKAAWFKDHQESTWLHPARSYGKKLFEKLQGKNLTSTP